MHEEECKVQGPRARALFFDHYGIEGGKPDIGLLRLVVTAYSHLPYENISKIIRKFTIPDGTGRLRGPVDVIGEHVDRGTGGTCFSLTWCLGAILTDCGFRCHPAMADMKRANIHCALIVHLAGGRYLVDPGYLLGEPMALGSRPERKETPFGRVELRPRGGEIYDLFTVAAGDRKWRYTLKARPVPAPVFMRHWRDSFALPMMNSMQLTRLTDTGHLYVRDHHLRHQTLDSKTNENIRADLESRIEAEFGIPGAMTAEAREYLERMKSEWRIQKRAGR